MKKNGVIYMSKQQWQEVVDMLTNNGFYAVKVEEKVISLSERYHFGGTYGWVRVSYTASKQCVVNTEIKTFPNGDCCEIADVIARQKVTDDINEIEMIIAKFEDTFNETR